MSFFTDGSKLRRKVYRELSINPNFRLSDHCSVFPKYNFFQIGVHSLQAAILALNTNSLTKTTQGVFDFFISRFKRLCYPIRLCLITARSEETTNVISLLNHINFIGLKTSQYSATLMPLKI